MFLAVLRIFLGLSQSNVVGMRATNEDRSVWDRAALLVWAAHTTLSKKTPVVLKTTTAF